VVAEGGTGGAEADVVAVERDVAGFQRDPVAAGVVPLMAVFRETGGSALDRVIVPRTANLISTGRPGRLVIAEVIAARSDPGPALPSLVTMMVRA
jgi:hypothetical protein